MSLHEKVGYSDHIVGVVNDENGTTNGVIVKKHRRQCLHYAQTTTLNILRHFNSPAQTQKRLLLRFSQKQNDNLKTLEEIGYEIYNSKNSKYKIGVINLMGNVFMRKTADVFQEAKKLSKDTIVIVNSCGDAKKDRDILKQRLKKNR